MADDRSLDPDQIDEWLAYSAMEEPEDSEPRRIDPFVIFGVVLGIVILIGLLTYLALGPHQLPTTWHSISTVRLKDCIHL